MIGLSRRAKESIKTGLAVVIAFAIALYLGWEKPYWAAFAVAMISLDTAGASLNKAAMRLAGTLVAGAVALTFVSLFAQQRWAMMAALSLYVGFCVYMIAGKRHTYFWFVSAFVALIIIVDATLADSLSAFRLTVARVEETAMGILVYSLISTFIWPHDSRGALEAAARSLAAAQGQLYRDGRALMAGQGDAEASRSRSLEEEQLVARLGQALAAAETDSYPVWELRHQWRRFHYLSSALMEARERWRETFPGIRDVDLSKPLPNLEEVCDAIGRRFDEIERLLAGEAPREAPEATALTLDRAEARALGHFQKAALAVAEAQLDRIEELSREMLAVVRDIRGLAAEPMTLSVQDSRREGLRIDPDRLSAAVRSVATLWIAFLIWVFVHPPQDELFVFMATHWTMVSALSRQSVTTMVPGVLVAIPLGGILYVLVMPKLSGYLELGTLLFLVTFALFYLFWPPRLRGVRSTALALVFVQLSISNQQTYDFSVFANVTAALLLSIALAVVTSYIPTSPRPEKAFLRLLRRFFRHAEYLLSRLALDRDQQWGWAARWKFALYSGDLLELPDKLAQQGQRIDYAQLPGDTPEEVRALVANLRAITHRLKDLSEARELPHSDVLVQRFHDELRDWRLVVQEQVRLWAEDPVKSVAPGANLEERLAARVARLDAKIEEAYRDPEARTLSERDYANFFRYLGGLRGLSEAGIGFIRAAQKIDWARWREARF